MLRLALASLLLPAALGAQRPRVTLVPHADLVAPGTFYRGPMLTGSPTARYDGHVRLASFTGWGARLSLHPAGSSWALELDGTTGGTTADVRGSYGTATSGGSFSLRGDAARLSLFSLGVARQVRAAGRGTVTARLAGTLASVTMEPRYIRPPSPSGGGYVVNEFEMLKPWARRYVSPGGEAGVSASLPIRGRFALHASGTAAVVRNETGDMGSGQQSIDSEFAPRREAYWMPVMRLTLGIGVAR